MAEERVSKLSESLHDIIEANNQTITQTTDTGTGRSELNSTNWNPQAYKILGYFTGTGQYECGDSAYSSKTGYSYIKMDGNKFTEQWASEKSVVRGNAYTYRKVFIDVETEKGLPIYQYFKDPSSGDVWAYCQVIYPAPLYPEACDIVDPENDIRIESNRVRYYWINLSSRNVTGTEVRNAEGSVLNDYTPVEPGNTKVNLDEKIKQDTGIDSSRIGEIVYGELNTGYENALYMDDAQYYESLYNDYSNSPYISCNSIIGLPMKFLPNVDVRYGNSTFGKQYTEDILYDMPIAVIHPGGPVLNPGETLSSDSVLGSNIEKIVGAFYGIYSDQLSLLDLGKEFLIKRLTGSNARFYSFADDYEHYVQYVNTICHVFAQFLGIGDKRYKPSDNTSGSNNTNVKYTNYDDTISAIEADSGSAISQQFGGYPAVFCYYQPESKLNQTFSNEMMESSLASKLEEASNMAKEYNFFMNSVGMESATDGLFNFQSLMGYNTSTLLGRIIGSITEKSTTILAGNNLSLPSIYSDSRASVSHELSIRLASPYGDEEAIFLYVLRPLARLLALALPRQMGPNSYKSPFLVQAFSKGQFNCQLGIVTSLSISRGGNGGESHTVHHIPTELDVNITIEDMYEKVMLSNEYNEGGLLSKLTGQDFTDAATKLFNNIGLLDFLASYTGYNLNAPQLDTQLNILTNMAINRISDNMQSPVLGFDDFRLPRLERRLNDIFANTVYRAQTFVTG